MTNGNEAGTAVTVSPKAEIRVGGPVQAIVPKNIDEMWRISTIISKSGMAPKGIDTPEKVMICLMHGQEVGFTAMAALQSIAPINGRPTIWGDGALGLVQGSGKMEWIKETVTGEGDARTATCIVKRFNDIEPKTGEFSVGDAKAAGLWKKAGPWTQYSDRMLKMRARSWALRDGFSDVLKGISIREEVEDYAPTAAPETPAFTATSAPAPAAIPRASEMAAAASVAAVEAEHEPVTPAAPVEPPAAEAPAAPAPAAPGPRTAKATAPAAPPQPPTGAIRLKEVPTKVQQKEDKSNNRTRFGITFSVGVVGTWDKDAAARANDAVEKGTPLDVAFVSTEHPREGRDPIVQRDLVWLDGAVIK